MLLCCQLAVGSGAAGELGPDKTSRRDVFLHTVYVARTTFILWIRPRTNSFIGSIGKSAPGPYHGLTVLGLPPVYSVRDVPGPYPG